MCVCVCVCCCSKKKDCTSCCEISPFYQSRLEKYVRDNKTNTHTHTQQSSSSNIAAAAAFFCLRFSRFNMYLTKLHKPMRSSVKSILRNRSVISRRFSTSEQGVAWSKCEDVTTDVLRVDVDEKRAIARLTIDRPRAYVLEVELT